MDYVLIAVALAAFGMMCFLVVGLSWGQHVVVGAVSAAVVATLLYSFRVMYKAGRQRRRRRQAKRGFSAIMKPIESNARIVVGELTGEANAHQERSPERAGEGQGQLISQFRGSTHCNGSAQDRRRKRG
jgi:hypothetical protein